MAKSRQEIENVFARLGIQQRQTTLPTFGGGGSFGTLPSFNPVEAAQTKPIDTVPTNFLQQLSYGITSPFRAGGVRLGVMNEAPNPSNFGGWAGNILGNMIGWGGVTALTMATFGAGAVALTGVTAGTLAATAVSAGTSGALVGAYSGWTKDKGVDQIVKEAAVGAATDLAFLGAGHAIRSLKSTKALKADTVEAIAKGLKPTEALAQHNPNRILDALTGMPADIADDITAKVYKLAGKYDLSVPAPQHLSHQGKIKWLSEVVNNYHGKIDDQIFQPLYKVTNDIYLRGSYSGLVTEGKATNLSKISKPIRKLFKKTPADASQTDWRDADERMVYEFKKLAKKEKAFGGGLFKKRTGIKEYDDTLKVVEKSSPDEVTSQLGTNARIAYMTPQDVHDYAEGLNPLGTGKPVAPTITAPTLTPPTSPASTADKFNKTLTPDPSLKKYIKAELRSLVASFKEKGKIDDDFSITIFYKDGSQLHYPEDVGKIRWNNIKNIAVQSADDHYDWFHNWIGTSDTPSLSVISPEWKVLVTQSDEDIGAYYQWFSQASPGKQSPFPDYLLNPPMQKATTAADNVAIKAATKTSVSQIPKTLRGVAKEATTLPFDKWVKKVRTDPKVMKEIMPEISKLRAPKGKSKWQFLWEIAQQQAAELAEETPSLTKKLSPVVLDFDKGVVHGLENVDLAGQAGVKGVPVLVISADEGHTAISNIPYHEVPNQLPMLMQRLGIENAKIQKAVDSATPFGEKKSLWHQMATVEEEIRNQGRGLKALYERNQVTNFEELNSKLQSMYMLLDETTGAEHITVTKEIKRLKKEIAQWESYTKLVDDLDIRRQKLIPYAEHTLGLESRGKLETAIGELIPDDPNVAHQTFAIPRETLRNFLEKYKVRRLRDIEWKNHPQARSEFKELVREAKRTGISLWDIHEQPMIAPTEYEKTKGILKAMLPLPKPQPITSKSIAKIEQRPKVTSIFDWFPRNRLSEPIFGRVRNASIQNKEFVHSYRTQLTEIIGKENMKPFSKTAKAFRQKLTIYLENPEQMDLDNVGEVVRNKVADLRELFNILGKNEFNVEGWQDNYVPHVMKLLQSGESRGFTPRELLPGFKLERTGEMGLEIRELDIYKLLDRYIVSGAREKYYQPVFDSLDPLFGLKRKGASLPDDFKKAASQVKFHASQKAYYEQLKSRMLGMPTGIEREFDEFVEKWVPDVARTLLGMDSSGRYMTQISAFMSELAYSGTLGYNPFAAIKNLTQQMSAVAQLSDNPLEGIDYWWKAKRMMSTKTGQELLETLNVARTGRNPKEALDLQMLSMSNIPGIGKLQKGAFKLFQWADTQNVDTSWMMRFLYERDRGFGIKEAVESAYSFTMATQFMYGVDSPLFFKGPVGSQIGMLMSWPLNFAAEIQQLGNSGEWNKAVTLLASYAFGAEALSLTGLSFRSIHPTEVAKGFLPIAMLEGEEAMSIPIRLTLASYDGLKALASGDPEARETAWDNFKRASRAYVPYSTQGRRILTTLEAVRNDYKIHERTLLSQVTNSEQGKGRLKYEMSKAEAILGLIGPTTNANNRWQSLETLATTESAYRRLRAQAINAFLADDYDKFLKKMTELRVRFGGKINISDIQQEIELRSMTNLQRRSTALPEAMRGQFNN